MSKKSKEAVYKFHADLGRSGDLEGVFVAKKSHIKILIDSEMEIYFGEVLGKHSEIYGKIEKTEIKMVSDNEDVINVIRTHELTSGYNPFDYPVLNPKRADFEGLIASEVCEILEKEMSK
ncbi:hypothetical protein [Elizabethkingia miricola]|uniref:hypothetical protein n=1 Tax=Elizabethkingia miricola TaxID=172045 RepID=UPI00099927BC|nr:hypothetical protein [Elizabethkingia miricola]OPC34598.1 hypothetical protein BAX99_06945 [Elizabethkingia miricola]